MMSSPNILLNLFHKFPYLRMMSYVGLLFFSIFVGALAVFLPIQFVIAFLMIPLFLILTWRFTEYSIFLLLFVLLGGISSSYLPKVSVAGGDLRAEDLGLIILFVLLLIKSSVFYQKNTSSVTFVIFFRPYIIPLGGLLLIAVLSAVIAVLYKTAPLRDIIVEARPYLTWLLLPILFMAINSDTKFQRFKKILLWLVVLLSLKVIFESFSGISLSEGGLALRELWTSGQGVFESVNRRTTPGVFVILAVLIYFLSLYVVDSRKATKNMFLAFILISILTLAILVSFGRGIWLATILMVILLGFFKPNKKYLSLVLWLVLGMFILVFILYLVKPAYVDAAASRFLSVSNEIKQGASLDRRFVENKYALEKIIEHPIVGVGLGGHYKPPGPEFITWPDEVRYIHNTYFNIATKLGVFGLFCALLFVVALFRRAFQVYKEVPLEFPVIFAAFSVLLVATVITAFTQPNLTSVGGIVSIVIAIFFIEFVSVSRASPKNI